MTDIDYSEAIKPRITKPKRIEPKSLLLYANHKVGKTEICGALTRIKDKEGNPIAFMLDINDGSNYIYRNGFNIDSRLTKLEKLTQFQRVIEELEKYRKKHKRNLYEYGILDELSTLDNWIEYYATLKYMKSSIGKKWNRNANGSMIIDEHHPDFKFITEVPTKNKGNIGYGKMREHFLYFLERFSACFDKVIYIGHVRDKIGDKSNDIENVTNQELDLTGKLRDIIPRNVDGVAKFIIKGDERWFSFVTQDEKSGVGIRAKYLAGKSLLISKAFREDKDDKEKISRIEFYWNSVYPSLKEYLNK